MATAKKPWWMGILLLADQVAKLRRLHRKPGLSIRASVTELRKIKKKRRCKCGWRSGQTRLRLSVSEIVKRVEETSAKMASVGIV